MAAEYPLCSPGVLTTRVLLDRVAYGCLRRYVRRCTMVVICQVVTLLIAGNPAELLSASIAKCSAGSLAKRARSSLLHCC